MRKFLAAIITLVPCVTISSQSEGTPFHALVNRVEKFGHRIPQEKVYVHMDNTSYMMGDTIWFKAYLRRTDTDKPSEVSRTLYVELRDTDGYLVERKLIYMTGGEGDGFFALSDNTFCLGGYYELRAYTRWQLNWGAHEHPHTPMANNWFFNKAAARDYFRDYDKLYSRVFPIFAEYEEIDGEMFPVMYARPTRRQFKKEPRPAKPRLDFFPEGGNLVAGLPNRVAFESATADGKHLDGWLYVNGDSVHTQNRGRGTFFITPQNGVATKISFVSKDGERIETNLDKPAGDGVTVSLYRLDDKWQAQIRMAGNVCADSLALTVMYEGRLEDFHPLVSLAQEHGAYHLLLDKAQTSGVHQLTVFDTQGRVLADRLFFVTQPKDLQPTLCIRGQKNEYKPYEPISLNIKRNAGRSGKASLSVRSNRAAARLHDNGNILTEMLLASEVRGFIPQPNWYFEADDDEHRSALDLLMLTQGWRRFPWQEMAIRGHFEIVHPAETSQILTGAVHTYQSAMKFDPVLMESMIEQEKFMGTPKEEIPDILKERFGLDETGGRRFHYGKDLKKNERADRIGATKDLRKRLMEDGEKLKHEVKVHADFLSPQGAAMWGESVTRNGTFRIQTPLIDEYCYMTLAASDTTKWSKAERLGKKEHQWYWHNDASYPEFYVRLSFPYPIFVKPYSYYQTHLAPASTHDGLHAHTLEGNTISTTVMKEVSVTGKRHNRLLSVTHTTPVIKMKAYDAFNMLVDGGLLNGWLSSPMQFGAAMARYLVSDMGQNRQYSVNLHYDDKLTNPGGLMAINGINPDAVIRKAGLMSMLDSVYMFTDYAPRKEGSPMYQASNQPEVDILFTLLDYPSPKNVDRFLFLPGFARSAKFYNPDYSRHTPSREDADYRRTLYWNPSVSLDDKGEAQVHFYNNALTGGILVNAQGQDSDGSLLWNKQQE